MKNAPKFWQNYSPIFVLQFPGGIRAVLTQQVCLSHDFQILESKAFHDSGKIQRFSQGFRIFLRNPPGTDPGNSHSLEFSEHSTTQRAQRSRKSFSLERMKRPFPLTRKNHSRLKPSFSAWNFSFSLETLNPGPCFSAARKGLGMKNILDWELHSVLKASFFQYCLWSWDSGCLVWGAHGGVHQHRVLRRFWTGFWGRVLRRVLRSGSAMGLRVLRRVLRRGSEKGLSRRCQNAPL